MPLNGEPIVPAGAPIAMATVTVDGRCRERSPVDLALFGPKSDRLIDRFLVAGEGQILFARATAEAAAEATAMLHTCAGRAPFRISLWRQRGGDKIRILAAFSQIDVEPNPLPQIMDGPDPMALALDALVGLTERLHMAGKDAQRHTTGDLLATAWRLKALNLARSMCQAPIGEVDLTRLIRRAARVAAAAGINCEIRPTSTAPVPLVIGDEGALWSLLDHLILACSAPVAAPAKIVLGLVYPDATAGLVLSISSAELPSANGQDRAARVAAARSVAARHDAMLEADSTKTSGFEARVTFPPHRCLAAP